MKYTKETYLSLFRGAGTCLLCGSWCAHREAAHVVATAQGGGKRLNLPINLWAAGPAWSCGCHLQTHRGGISQAKVIDAVAFREGLQPDFLRERLWQLVRAPKGCKVCLSCLGAGSIKVETHWGFRRHECVCAGVGIFDEAGDVYREPPRQFSGALRRGQ